jgi:hypothetical protein
MDLLFLWLIGVDHRQPHSQEDEVPNREKVTHVVVQILTRSGRYK